MFDLFPVCQGIGFTMNERFKRVKGQDIGIIMRFGCFRVMIRCINLSVFGFILCIMLLRINAPVLLRIRSVRIVCYNVTMYGIRRIMRNKCFGIITGNFIINGIRSAVCIRAAAAPRIGIRSAGGIAIRSGSFNGIIPGKGINVCFIQRCNVFRIMIRCFRSGSRVGIRSAGP